MPLYVARTTIDVVFWSEGEPHPFDGADALEEECRDNSIDADHVVITPIESAADLPAGWGNSIPRLLPDEVGDKTCRELLGHA